MSVTLESLGLCFEGLIPAGMATCASDGIPNISYVSQVYYVDSRHVAISFQFFNKTRKNIQENPYASVFLHEPLSLRAFRLSLKFVRSEESGPLFDRMALQLQVIASHTGMTGVFALRAADIYEVLEIQSVEGFTTHPRSEFSPGLLPRQPDIDSLMVLSEHLALTDSLSDLVDSFLKLLEQRFGFQHSILLMPELPGSSRLQTIASHGYAENGVGSEVRIGDGLIGTVAESRRPLRISGISESLRYARAVRNSTAQSGGALNAEIPLPGLPGASSQIAVPLLSRSGLVGVLAVESPTPGAFGHREESLLSILSHQLGSTIQALRSDPASEEDQTSATPPAQSASKPPSRVRNVSFFSNEECLFIDGEYLIRNVAGKILWRLLQRFTQEGRTEFTNRELRMDSWLGLPDFKDNLESRLILLRKRLEQKCPDIRIVQRGRGRFALETDSVLLLKETRN